MPRISYMGFRINENITVNTSHNNAINQETYFQHNSAQTSAIISPYRALYPPPLPLPIWFSREMWFGTVGKALLATRNGERSSTRSLLGIAQYPRFERLSLGACNGFKCRMNKFLQSEKRYSALEAAVPCHCTYVKRLRFTARRDITVVVARLFAESNSSPRAF